LSYTPKKTARSDAPGGRLRYQSNRDYALAGPPPMRGLGL